jgi:DNA-binding transcriptional LysR family regulator
MSRSFGGTALGSIELFLRAAETESFAAAAVTLGLSPPAVSRAIGRLEARLGVRLFQRTTRKVSLTDDGRLYFQECREALAQIAAVEDALAGRQRKPSGQLRISVPTTYAHYRFMKLVPAFREQYPGVSLALHVSNRNVDLIEEGYDLAIRLGKPADSRLVARKLEDATLGIFAAPNYLAGRAPPCTIGDLKRHVLIAFERPSTGKPMPWLLRQGENVIEFDVEAGISCSEDVLGCVSLARAGAGLFQIYHFVAAEAVRQGQLVEVLHKHAGASRPFSILYPQNRHLSARMRVFVEFLLGEVARQG